MNADKTNASVFEPRKWILEGLPKTVKVELFDDVSFAYELKLAKMELSRWWKKLDEFRKRTAYFEKVNNKKTYHCFISDIKGKGQIGRTNQYLTHWFYPYKAKFHPQMIKALINWMGLKEGDTLLDPMVGSGTALVEAKTIGVNSIGVDISSLCTLISRVKCNLLDLKPENLKSVDKKKVFNFFDKRIKRISEFVPSSVKNELDISDERVFEFYQLCYMYALSDYTYVKRDMWKAFNNNLDKILLTIKIFDQLKRELNFKLGDVEVKEGDARKLKLNKKIDGIITSPPYSIAVDYIKNDLHALEFMNIDVRDLRKNMVGLRGKGEEKILNYWNDMKLVFENMHNSLRKSKFCVVLVGDVTYNGKKLPIHKKFVEMAEDVGFRCVDIIRRPILGGFARLRYEYVLIFQKV